MNRMQILVPLLFLVGGVGLILFADASTREGVSRATSGGFMVSLGGMWLYLLYKGGRRERPPEEDRIEFKSDWME